MAEVVELTDDGFSEAVATGVVLVDFWAPWCGPCQRQGPIVEEVAEAVGGKATIAKINVDEHSQAASDFGVMSIPTLIVFKDGEEVERFVAVQTKETLVDAVERAISA